MTDHSKGVLYTYFTMTVAKKRGKRKQWERGGRNLVGMCQINNRRYTFTDWALIIATLANTDLAATLYLLA